MAFHLTICTHYIVHMLLLCYVIICYTYTVFRHYMYMCVFNTNTTVGCLLVLYQGWV